MKQMRSRFRLITLLLVCAFLLTLVLCAGKALKVAGVTLSSVSSGVVSVMDKMNPETSVSPEPSPAAESTPGAPESVSPDPALPGTDNSVDLEYDISGL